MRKIHRNPLVVILLLTIYTLNATAQSPVSGFLEAGKKQHERGNPAAAIKEYSERS